MEKELLNVINAAYDRLETKQAEIVHALSHGKDELRSGWYNHHYHKDDRGNWTREAYPIPVIGVNGVCDIEIHSDTISVTAKLKRGAALAYSFEEFAGYPFEAYGVEDYLADYYHPGYDKPINANIATDMREALEVPNTFKNCVNSTILPYSRDLAEKSLAEQAAEYRRLLAAQRDRDYCRKEANAMIGLSDKLDSLPSYEEKQKIMSFYEGMTLNTYIISSLGSVRLGENAPHIQSVHLYNSGTTGLGINMICCGGSFIVDFKQNFSSDRYVRAFCGQLASLGIEYQASEVIPFVTPGDSLVKREQRQQKNVNCPVA